MITLKTKINNYLTQNPIDNSQPNKYAELRTKFNLTAKQASAYYIDFNKQYGGNLDKFPVVNYTTEQVNKILKQEGDNLSVTLNTDFEVKSLEDLIKACDVDTTKWEVVAWQCKKWDLGIKNKDNAIETKALYSVSAKFKAIKIEQNLQLQKDIILAELFDKAQLVNWESNKIKEKALFRRDNLLEIAMFDLHFGKLAHREEVGEDYDITIATERFKEALYTLLSRVNLDSVDRILFPIGQDLINVDNLVNTTTGGTPQDCDSRFHKIIKTVKKVLIEAIEYLSTLAPVDVVVCVGNHDEQTSFMIGEILEAYFCKNELVSVFNGASLRKYYQYGVSSIMFTHGNKEKFNELGMIFAAENPKLWANTTQRYVQIGHFHHNKKITTLQAQEFQGFQVQILPSLSGSDAWHTGKGYQSLKQAKAFLYNKTSGLIGEFTHTAV